jgi:hypothetical protein
VTVCDHRRFRRRLLKQIARRSTGAQGSEIARGLLNREVERYLAAHAVQSAVRYDIWLKEFKKEDADKRWASAQQQPVVTYDYRRFRSSPVSYFHKARTTAGVRKICRFNEVEKMWHVMARDLIVAQHQPRPHIGDWLDRGRDMQIDQIRSALVSPRQAVVCADITRAFASVNIDAVYELHYLPEPLIRRAIDHRSHRFIRRERSEYLRDITIAARNSVSHNNDYDDDVLERSPSGLMEGSPASNAIFSVLMDDLPDHVGEGIQSFVYCDNIILIAPTMSCAQRAQEALARYLSGHRAGPFEMRSRISPAYQRFEHLGYTLRRLPRLPADVGIATKGWISLAERLFADQPDMDETIRWLKASYGQCFYSSFAEFLELAGVQAA